MFACRRCYRLTYRSQYQPAFENALCRVKRIFERLGRPDLFEGGDFDHYPPRPRGMHQRTYERLLDHSDALMAEYDDGWCGMVCGMAGRLMKRYG
jgi:hypothetical protein